MLAERPTQANGFFDIPYTPPADPANGQVKSPYHLVVRVLGAGDAEVSRKVVFNPTSIAWVNFVDGDQPYRGTSEFDERLKLVSHVVGTVPIVDLEETETDQDITYVSVNTGLTLDDVMRLVLADAGRTGARRPGHRPGGGVRLRAAEPSASLPGDLLGSTEKWALIDQLVEFTAVVSCS